MQLTFRDIMRIFKAPEHVVQEWIEKKKMPCVKTNERYRFNYISLLEWALDNKINLTSQMLALSETQLQGNILSGALKNGDIHYDVLGNNREEVLKGVVDLLPLPEETDRSQLFEMLWSRELMGSTAIGGGIAIPHVRNPIVLNIDQPVITTCFLKNSIDFKALDHQLVSTLFVVLTPSVKMHLALLARLAYCLQDAQLQKYLGQKAPREEILAYFFVLESRLDAYKNGSGKGLNVA